MQGMPEPRAVQEILERRRLQRGENCVAGRLDRLVEALHVSDPIEESHQAYACPLPPPTCGDADRSSGAHRTVIPVGDASHSGTGHVRLGPVAMQLLNPTRGPRKNLT